MIRSGQLHSTGIFNKDNVKETLKNEPLKPVEEDINLLVVYYDEPYSSIRGLWNYSVLNQG